MEFMQQIGAWLGCPIGRPPPTKFETDYVAADESAVLRTPGGGATATESRLSPAVKADHAAERLSEATLRGGAAAGRRDGATAADRRGRRAPTRRRGVRANWRRRRGVAAAEAAAAGRRAAEEEAAAAEAAAPPRAAQERAAAEEQGARGASRPRTRRAPRP